MNMAHKLMMDWSNKEDVKRGITLKWQDNAVKNIAFFDAHPEKMLGSIHDMPTHEGKAVIFVGRGQSLQKAIDMFDTIDDRFIIVCTNSSLRYLLEHGVIPNYMICIDGEKGSWTFDNLPEGAEKVTAIFAPGAYHEEVIKWQGKIIVVPYGVKKGSVQKEIRKRWGKSIPAGGNALNGAVAIFLMRSLIRIYVFVGNNLSFKEDELFYFNQETDRDDKAYFIMNNIYGEEVLTDMPMYQYKVWLEQACNQYFPECVFINASEGILGVDVDGSNMDIFQYMPLDIAIEHIKEALDFDLLDPIEKNRVFYQKLYDDSDYNPTNGNRTWESILRLIGRGDITIEKGLDVGCGTGGGVKLARDNGYDVYGCDISNNERIWKENGIGDFCKQAPANNMPYEDNSFNFVYCGDVMEHIPEEYLLPTLKEIYRVGSHKFLFVICTALERSPVGVTTPVYTHISVKTADEWKKMICSVGYKIAQIETIDDHVAFKAVKE